MLDGLINPTILSRNFTHAVWKGEGNGLGLDGYHPPCLHRTSVFQIPGGNPIYWILEPGANTLTIEYDATPYLDPVMQALGFRATFQTDVPEPASISLVGLALAGLGFGARRRGTAAMV